VFARRLRVAAFSYVGSDPPLSQAQPKSEARWRLAVRALSSVLRKWAPPDPSATPAIGAKGFPAAYL
jgi:hypothetical protein